MFVLRSLLDNAYENEAKCKSEAEQAKRELTRVQVSVIIINQSINLLMK